MTMWLFDGDRRAEYMTASAAGPRCRTQASNFSFCSRSGAPPFMKTASMPNCLKQSERSEPVGSLISTRATRAEFFLVGRGGASVIPEVFCMAPGNSPNELHFRGQEGVWQRVRRTVSQHKSLITRNGLPIPYLGS